MFGLTALILVTLGGAANLHAPTVSVLPRLTLVGEVRPAPESADFGLRSSFLSGYERTTLTRAMLAQTPSRTPATAAAIQNTPTPAPTAGGGSDAASACGEQCDIDCETCRESDRQARYVIRRRAAILRTHRAFAITAWGSMVVTQALGTMLAINQGTWFGRGNCVAAATDSSQTRIFGAEFGCGGGLLALHQTFAFFTVGFYTTAAVLAVSAPDPDNESVGTDTHARTLRLHKAVAWVHAAGMILLPILGVLSVHPELFLNSSSPTYGDSVQSYQNTMRSIHTLVGYSTLAALTFAMILEF